MYLSKIIGILTLSISVSLHAQSNQSTSIFKPEFYADANPVNALDMVERTPGFSLNSGNSNLRGLEGASGNVLIDGRPPTSKSLSLSELLQQIPAENVERIDMIRGGATGIDMMGHNTVLNVIRKTEISTRTAAQISGRYYPSPDNDIGGGARLEYARTAGRLTVDGAIEYSEEQPVDAGEGFVYQSPRGSLPELRGTHIADNWQSSLLLSGNTAYQTDEFTLSANLVAEIDDRETNQYGELHSALGDTIINSALSNQEDNAYEAGLDASRRLSDTIQLNGKLLYSISDSSNQSNQFRPDSVNTAEVSNDDQEVAVRLSLRWQPSSSSSYEIGAETARNTLDSHVRVFTNGDAIVLPNDDVEVTEDRSEFFFETTQQLLNNLIAEFGLNYETSTLSQRGDSNLQKDLDYIKPRLALTWPVSSATELSIQLEREVGQLNFSTFAASPSLTADISSGGNASLEPETANKLTLQLEQSFWDEGSVVLAFEHSNVDNALDYIPVGNGFDALGNAGKAQRNRINVNLTFPFDRLGIEGLTFRTNMWYYHTQIDDPISDEQRYLSERNRFTGRLWFTWDLPQFNSVVGIDGFWGYINYQYRLSERRVDQERPVPASIWWERTFNDDLLLHVEIHNIAEQRRTRVREIYAPDSYGQIEATEVKDTTNKPYLMVSLRKTF